MSTKSRFKGKDEAGWQFINISRPEQGKSQKVRRLVKANATHDVRRRQKLEALAKHSKGSQGSDLSNADDTNHTCGVAPAIQSYAEIGDVCQSHEWDGLVSDAALLPLQPLTATGFSSPVTAIGVGDDGFLQQSSEAEGQDLETSVMFSHNGSEFSRFGNMFNGNLYPFDTNGVPISRPILSEDYTLHHCKTSFLSTALCT